MPTITGVADSGQGHAAKEAFFAQYEAELQARGSAVRGGAGDGPAGVRVLGYVRPGPDTRMDCQRPLRVMRGDEVEFWTCDSYGCDLCAVKKQRRLQRLIHDGISHQNGTGAVGYFLTVTAPGVNDHQRWFQGRRPATRQVCECHRHGMTQGRWNSQESACWNRLRTAIARSVGSVQFVGSVEVQQERGALHRHIVIYTQEPLHFDEVQSYALAAGYGCVMDLEPLESPEKAARYLSKYVTKASTARGSIPWEVEVVDYDTGEVSEVGKRPTYRLWSSSQRWGVTMKEIRAVAAAQARQRAMYLRELHDLVGSEAGSLAPVSAAAGGTDPPI